MNKFILLCCALLVVIGMVACNHTKCGNCNSIQYDTDYVLEVKSLCDVKTIKNLPEQNITIGFKKEPNNQVRVYGCAGVNRYFGIIKLDEICNNISIKNLGITQMAGIGIEVEDLYLKTLRKVDRFKLENNTLILSNANENINLIFK